VPYAVSEWLQDMQTVELDRFRLDGLLGLGANYEVYAATDRETNHHVVLKRPWVQYLRGGQYRSVDQFSAQLIQIHARLDRTLPHVGRLVGYTERRRHDQYFGDSLPQEYHVLVEERARGVPLVADIKEKFRGIPIGLAQNLFALYPLVRHHGRQLGDVLLQLLDVEEAFTRADCLVKDLRPQNVFFDPQDGAITVIDIGDFADTKALGERSQTVDIHDCLAELCRFYLAPHPPPDDAKRYREPFGMEPSLGFRRDIDRIIGMYQGLTAGTLQEAGMTILQQIRNRQYGAVEPFRRDVQEYFRLIESRNTSLQEFPDLVEIWRQGMALLQHKYWQKFLFDPVADLMHYA
jgi:serine/threonine protein kinase